MRPDARPAPRPNIPPDTERPEPGIAPRDVRTGATPRKQIYLRTVYPLNPGIPHFVDVPGGW